MVIAFYGIKSIFCSTWLLKEAKTFMLYLFRWKVPENQQDFEAIISGLVSYHWLGISDKDSEGVYKNIYTGENAYVQWRSGEPNGRSNEVIIYF